MVVSRIASQDVFTHIELAQASMNEAANAARSSILNAPDNPLVVVKNDNTPVTEVDLAADQAIRSVLSSSALSIPILSEEADSINPESPRYWTVDPIDGTVSFIRRIPLFAVLLGLVWDHVPVAGLIDLPSLNMRMEGADGRGCFLNGEPVFSSDAEDLSIAMVSHGDVSTFDVVGEREGLEQLGKLVPMRRGYTDGFGYAMTVAGRVDLMIDVNINPWETIPIRILTKEAGGTVASKTFDNGKQGVIFGAPALVSQVMGLMMPGWKLDTN